MFRAIGIGFSRSLPAVAALNWVFKDGLGRLSRCIYTASLASAFDTNLKVANSLTLSGIYQGLKHVHLQTLTKDRLEILLNNWIELGYVPAPAQVSKEEGTGTADVIMGLLQACYIRKALVINKWETMVDAGDALDSAPKEWSKSVEECKRRAQGNMNALTEQIMTFGWAAKNTLLSAQEQIRYSSVDD